MATLFLTVGMLLAKPAALARITRTHDCRIRTLKVHNARVDLRPFQYWIALITAEAIRLWLG